MLKLTTFFTILGTSEYLWDADAYRKPHTARAPPSPTMPHTNLTPLSVPLCSRHPGEALIDLLDMASLAVPECVSPLLTSWTHDNDMNLEIKGIRNGILLKTSNGISYYTGLGKIEITEDRYVGNSVCSARLPSWGSRLCLLLLS